MVEKPFELVWTNRSQKNIEAIYNYILRDSPPNAKRVVNDIRIKAEKMIFNPGNMDEINIK